jgi:hypothetical protein
MKSLRRICFCVIALVCLGAAQLVVAQTPISPPAIQLQRVAIGLQNPRGVAVLPNGSLLVGEAGAGQNDPVRYTGRVSVFTDKNGDGNYDDPGEIAFVLVHLPTCNSPSPRDHCRKK